MEELVYLLAHKKIMHLPKLEKAVTSVGLELHALLPDDVAPTQARKGRRPSKVCGGRAL